MSASIYIGTDGGATTSKVGGVWSDGSVISTKLLQSSTNSTQGPEAVVRSWVDTIDRYLADNSLTWDQVRGVGLAVPGPFQRYGVFDHSANLPDSFTGLTCIPPTAAP
jgi:glucokinase